MTKRETLEMIKDYVLGVATGKDVDLDVDAAIAFCENEIHLLDGKAQKAKERAAAKKEAGDELRDAVEAVLTDEFKTLSDIALLMAGYEDITVSKITARLTQLVNLGKVEKTDVKVENADGKKRTVKAYRLVA